jgi:hypothetical protein
MGFIAKFKYLRRAGKLLNHVQAQTWTETNSVNNSLRHE